MNQEDLMLNALRLPYDAIAYAVSRQLAALYPDAAIIEGTAASFDLEEYVKAGLCRAELRPIVHNQITTVWQGTGYGLAENAENAWYSVSWQGQTLDVVLLLGSPGNGKTHTVKALINELRQPCLYVKSLRSEYGTDHRNIRSVFARARQTTPCLLVMEDLDSLINDKNRSFFLNELDGFAANTGIVVVATNHPERLDPAILERPSRFDRKYFFALPGPNERREYLTRWNEGMEPDLRLSSEGLTNAVALTDEYSFAYLKELWLSSMMRWIAAPQPGGMDAIMAAQAVLLREQMRAAPDEPRAEFLIDDDEDE